MTKDLAMRTPRKVLQKRSAPASDIDDDSPSKRLARAAAGMDLKDDHTTSHSAHAVALRSSTGGEASLTDSTATLDQSNTTVEAATIEPGLSVLGKHVTKLVDLITALRDNGVDRLALDLPQIVVVGDQSTGKSSLIEGLSAIKVPRDEGTCTRCPIEINLKPTTDGAWHCRISVVKKYGYKVANSGSGSALGLGPYNVELPTAVIEPFVEVTNKDDIPRWLQRAQMAILNPGHPYQQFAVPLTEKVDCPSPQESFSPNVIRMDIFAPGSPSLSFFDLPGVIVQDSEQHVPQLIRKLVKGYIESSKSLVLLTLPIDCDRANSQAAGLVSEAKAEDRTIGIISKPDRLVSANLAQWKEILSGKKFSYRLGYRVVKNPADPRVSWENARSQERKFFETDYNFRAQLRAFEQQFGTDRLTTFLSKHLLTMIKDSLPEIQEKVANRVAIINEELSTLPKPVTGNVVFRIQQRIHNFEELLMAVITNAIDQNTEPAIASRIKVVTWFQDWHKQAQIFYEQLVQSAPQLEIGNFRPSGSASTQKNTVNGAILIESDDSEDDNSTTVRPQNHTIPALQSTLNERDKKDIRDFVGKSTTKFTLAQLQKCVHRYNNGVYGISDPRVFEHLVSESTRKWQSCVERFLTRTGQACQGVVDELLAVLFADLQGTKLLERMEQSAHDLVKELHDKQRSFSTLLLNVERRSPLTLNREEQETAKHAILVELVEQVQNANIKRQLEKLTESQGRRYTALEEKRITEQIRHDPNQNYQELVELAGAIAYYRIAARRLADYTALSMRNNYFYGLTSYMQAKIREDLGLNFEGDSDLNRINKQLIKLMAPPQAQFERRQQLIGELDILTRTTKDVLSVLSDDHDDDNERDLFKLKQEPRPQKAKDIEMEE